MPILIILLFYASDLIKYRKYQESVDAAAPYISNMIQNVTQHRSNKLITYDDLKNVCKVGTLNLNNFGATRHYMPLFLVKGTGKDKCKIMWGKCCGIQMGTNLCYYDWAFNDQGKMTNDCTVLYLNYSGKTFYLNTEYTSTDLYPDLHLNADEFKMIFEVNSYGAPTPDKRKSTYGFYLLASKGYKSINFYITFHSHVIFTPKPGIFDENNPPS